MNFEGTGFQQKSCALYLSTKIVLIIWNAAFVIGQFNFWMNKMDTTNHEAKEWFNHPNWHLGIWSWSFMREGAKCDILLNSSYECFNRNILNAKEKLIITMLEIIKNCMMKWFYVKRHIGENWVRWFVLKFKKRWVSFVTTQLGNNDRCTR